MSFFVSFADINFIINRSFCRAVKPKGIKTSFFAKLSFSKEKVDVIISKIFFGTNK